MEGTHPWISAYPCWKETAAKKKALDSESMTTNVSGELTLDLYMGMTHPEVATVQKLLNKAGFTLAESGPGSPGNETTMFGLLTRNAVRRFQCAKGIACSGGEYDSSYGLVESRTRAALLGRSRKY
jgi:peptidoglycan hydrolase-like protein with peptidoglycan-binding domain